jgi:hypothetical protein
MWVIYADRISGTGDDASYTIGDAPDPIAKSFDSAHQWYLFYAVTAGLTGGWLFIVIIYHLMYSDNGKQLSGFTWPVYTDQYITSLTGSLMFRIITCSMMAVMIEQVRKDTVKNLERNYDGVTALFGSALGNEFRDALLATIGTAYIPEDVATAISTASEDAAKRAAITSAAALQATPAARASFIAVQDLSLVLLLVLVPMFITVLSRVWRAKEYVPKQQAPNP